MQSHLGGALSQRRSGVKRGPGSPRQLQRRQLGGDGAPCFVKNHSALGAGVEFSLPVRATGTHILSAAPSGWGHILCRTLARGRSLSETLLVTQALPMTRLWLLLTLPDVRAQASHHHSPSPPVPALLGIRVPGGFWSSPRCWNSTKLEQGASSDCLLSLSGQQRLLPPPHSLILAPRSEERKGTHRLWGQTDQSPCCSPTRLSCVTQTDGITSPFPLLSSGSTATCLPAQMAQKEG